jgi:hypothetical protein
VYELAAPRYQFTRWHPDDAWARGGALGSGKGEDAAVCAAIESHMYPLGPAPTSREAWVLVLADKAASLGDIKQFLVGLIDGSSLRIAVACAKPIPIIASVHGAACSGFDAQNLLMNNS